MKVTLADLEQVARALGIKVTYEDLKTSKGGSSRLRETRRVIIKKHPHANETAIILARELGRFDLGGIEVPEPVKRKIQRESDHQSPLRLSA